MLAQAGSPDMDAGLKGSLLCTVGGRYSPGAYSHTGYQGQILYIWDISKTTGMCLANIPSSPCYSHAGQC